MSLRQPVCALLLLLLSTAPVLAQTQNPAAPALDPKLCAVPATTARDTSDKNAKRQARKALESARKAYLAGDFARSIASLQAAYALDPLTEILYNIAQACREAGLEAEALPLYESVLKHDPTPEQKEATEAKITELRPRIAEKESAAAVRALDDKQYTQASEGLKRAYALNPLPIYLYQLGQAQRLAGRTDEAIASYEQFLSRSPSGDQPRDARKYLNRLRAQKEDQKASDHFNRAEYVKAILIWDAAYKLDSRATYLFRKAEALYQAGQTREAQQEYQRFLRESPEVELRELRVQAEARMQEIRAGAPVPQPLRSGQPGPPIAERKPVYKRWWFWVAIGGAVAAAGAATAVGIVASQPPPIPEDRPRFSF